MNSPREGMWTDKRGSPKTEFRETPVSRHQVDEQMSAKRVRKSWQGGVSKIRTVCVVS